MGSQDDIFCIFKIFICYTEAFVVGIYKYLNTDVWNSNALEEETVTTKGLD